MRITEFTMADDLTRNFVAMLLEYSTMLKYMDFVEISGHSEKLLKSPTTTGGTTRAINSDFPDNVQNPTEGDAVLTIFGDKLQIDKALKRRFDGKVGSIVERKLRALAKTAAKKLDDMIFNGDKAAVATAFNGFVNLVKTAMSFTPNLGQYPNGLIVSLGNGSAQIETQRLFRQLVNNMLEAMDGEADFIAMDGATLSVFTLIAEGYIKTERDAYGKMIKYYNGTPLINPGKAGNSKIISQNKPYGTAYTVADVTTNTITATSSAFSDGDAIVFSGSDAPGALVLGTVYYVRDASGATFKVATTPGGAAETVADAGTSTVQLAKSTTIFAGKYGEEEDIACATSTGFDVDDLGIVGSHQVYSAEFDVDQVLLNDYALAMLTGIIVEA